MEQNRENASQVDIGYLLKILRSNIVFILIVAIICAGGLGAFKFLTTTPTYTSTVSFFVNGLAMDSKGDVIVANQNASTGRYLAEAYAQVLSTNGVATAAVKKLPEGEKFALTPEQVQRYISIPEVETQIITVKVTHEDAEVAYELASAIENVTPGELDYIAGIVSDKGSSESQKSVVKVIDSPVLDETPSGRGTVVAALIGFILGAAVVYLVAFLRAFLDNTIYTEEDVKEYFKHPVIGQIPTWANENAAKGNKKRSAKKKGAPSDYMRDGAVSTSSRDYTGRILSDTTPFAIAEAFKLLRTNMCYTTKGESCAVYGVTSAYVGAGKSMVLANTAISFSQMGKKVLLVDGDLRCPVQHRIFNLDVKAAGLSELLAGVKKDISEVVRPSGVAEGLDVITSGRIPPNPAELLASSRMVNFIAEAKEKYDVVFIDLPPICEVTDAGVISELVTGYAFVIRAAYSDRNLVAIAVETMEGLGSSIAGFILNDVDIKSGDYYKNKYGNYGKYSKYGYGKYDRTGTDYRYGYAPNSHATDDKQ